MIMLRMSFAALVALALSGRLAGEGVSDDLGYDAGEVMTSSVADNGWELVWSDEFEGDALDLTKWTPEESCWGGGNNERQCYTAREANVSVEDGFLYLKARKEEFTGPDRPPEIALDPNPQVTQPYTSGKVRTLGLHSWKYGRIEARAKVPKGQGTWVAFWMMPEKAVYGGWPLSGEIDIMEAVNQGASCNACKGDFGENRSISALHFGGMFPDNTYVSKASSLPSLALQSDDFHVYSVEWGEGLIRFLVDDQVHFTARQEDWFTVSEYAAGRPAAPFDQEFYVMANLAVGGRLSEDYNDKTFEADTFPTEFVIDWVRVYQCGPDREKGLACIEQADGGR